MKPGRASRGPNRLYVRLERVMLGAGMTAVAFVIERRLLRALKKGQVQAAARRGAEGPPAGPGEQLLSLPIDRESELSPAPQQVDDQPGG